MGKKKEHKGADSGQAPQQGGRGQQQQQGGRGQQQQQGGRGQQQQQGGRGQQQQQGGRGQPQQQQGGRGQQQGGRGQPYQQQGGRGQQPHQQQGGSGQPPQQQAWRGQPQSPPPHQQQGGSGQPPQQQAWRGQPQSPPPHQQQGGSGQPPQQQAWRGQPQQVAPQQGPPPRGNVRFGPPPGGNVRFGPPPGGIVPQFGQQQGPPPFQQGPPQGAPQQQLAPPVQQGPTQGAPQQRLPQPFQQPSGVPQQQQHESAAPKQSQASKQQKREGDSSSRQSPTAPPVVASATGAVDLLKIPVRRRDIDRSSKTGKRIPIEVNHMELKLKNYKIKAYHYDVVFDPDKPKFLLRPAMKKFFENNFPGRYPIFDGNKNLFSNGPLVPNDRGLSAEVTIFNEESLKEKTIMITIAPVNKIDMSDLINYQTTKDVNPYKALLVVDVALRAKSAFHLAQNGNRFFSPPAGRIIQLGGGAELWHGHYQAASLGWKTFLNLDISNKAFYSALTVEEAIEQVCQADPRKFGQRWEVEALSKHFKGLKIDYKIPGQENSRRVFRVNGVEGSATFEKFKDDTGKTWTIESYYQEIKKYRLQKPWLPCLWVGSRQKKVMLPGELCKISPGQDKKHTDEQQTAHMVRAATSTTDQRKDNIMSSLRNSGLNDSNEYMREFGISIAGAFERVEARILDAPDLDYAKNQTVRVQKGVWRAGSFTSSPPLEDWAILCINHRTREDELRRLSDMLCSQARSFGMAISPASVFEKLDLGRNPMQGKRALEGFFQKMRGKQLVFVVVPDRGDGYALVKTVAEITVGVLTQCIKGQTMYKLNPATVGNILLKVNAKLDGVNHSIGSAFRPPCLKRPVMLVGADVTHPAPGQTNMPSIAAVAASHDPKAFKYNMVWRMQPKGEMIQDLEEIMKEQLMFFYQMTKQQKPEKILFFRDGVSEGEIQKVMSQEVKAIRRACRALSAEGYEPAITFLVVQKRHHTRFFPTPECMRDVYDRKNNNLPAGTIVDTEIVHPLETEFLLLSHASILGTARPTKYRLVWDDSNFEENELEQLTYYLCHMFTRCTRSVSYPAPTYYAHLAAFRARNYLAAQPADITNLKKEQNLRKMNEDLMKKNPMFFV